MKKNLILMLALAGSSLALEEVTSAELAATPVTNATVALTLDVKQMKSISDVSFGGINETPTLFYFNGTWGNGMDGNVGVCNNGSSGNDVTGVYGYASIGSVSSKKNLSTGLGSIFTSDTDWDSITGMSLVCSVVNNEDNDKVSMRLAVSISKTDGTITTYGGGLNEDVLHWTIDEEGVDGFTIKGVTFNSDLVYSSTTYKGALSLDEAQALSAQLIPEPTTATLSLLALAGLAARRRRR